MHIPTHGHTDTGLVKIWWLLNKRSGRTAISRNSPRDEIHAQSFRGASLRIRQLAHLLYSNAVFPSRKIGQVSKRSAKLDGTIFCRI